MSFSFENLSHTKITAKPVICKQGLYIVSVPIGNIWDISLRALELLSRVDLVICEDTRVTNSLLSMYGIQKSLIAYHEHNAPKVRQKVMDRLAEGKTMALVSDAGTPMISDPGYKLIREAIDLGFYVTTLPGASAVLPALILSGFPSNEFTFLGFLPTTKEKLSRFLDTLPKRSMTYIIYETGRRLIKTLAGIKDVLGNIKLSISKDLTKSSENVFKGGAVEMIERLEKEGNFKGEYVICFHLDSHLRPDVENISPLLKELLLEMPLKKASQILANYFGVSKRDLYEHGLFLQKGKDV